MEAIKIFCENLNADLKLKIIGRNAPIRLSCLHGNKYVDLMKEVSFTDRKTIYNEGVASLVIQRPLLKYFAVPSKAFYSWENGLPIVYFGSRESELHQLVTLNPFLGIAFDFNEVGSVASKAATVKYLEEYTLSDKKLIKSYLSSNYQRSITTILKVANEGV